MITPAESLARCRRELHPAVLYSVQQVARVIGLNVSNVLRAITRGSLECRDEAPYRCYGHQVLAWAKWRADQVEAGTGVMAIAHSQNAKLGGAAITLVARQSCPTTCAFREQGCYAEHDNNRIWWDRLTAGAPRATLLQLAQAEADAIDGLPADRDLRLHVAGDSTTAVGTGLIADACARYVERAAAQGLTVRAWGYTHAWRTVPRAAWGTVSILASCETPADVLAARTRGYAAALVVDRFADDAAYALEETAGVAKMLPCPQQTRDRTCTACRLCFDDSRLQRAGLAIGFALHGGGTNKARVALTTRRPLPMAV